MAASRTESEREEVAALKERLSQAERQLHRIKVALICAIVALIGLVVPPVGLVVFVAVLLGALFAYMYSVVWVVERLVRVGGNEPRTDDRSNSPS